MPVLSDPLPLSSPPAYGVSDAGTDLGRHADWPGKRLRACRCVWLNGRFWKPSCHAEITLGFYFRRLRVEPGPLGGLRWVIEARTCEAPGWPEGAVVVGKGLRKLRPGEYVLSLTPSEATRWVVRQRGRPLRRIPAEAADAP